MSRREAARFTAVLEIDPAEMGSNRYSGANVCGQRLYLSELLLALAHSKQRPNVVLVDKYFGPKTCVGKEGEDNTAALRRGITEASEIGMKVVVGVRLRQDDRSAAEEVAKATKTAIKKRARPVEPVLPLESAELGVLNLATDVRQLPLVFQGISLTDGLISERESIAWKAARLFDPGNMQKLTEMFDPTDEHAPYIGFLERRVTKKHTFSALDAICGLAKNRADSLGLDCSRAMTFPADRLQNRVVLIGEKTENDVHDSPIGKIHGYFLHANYVEALLDGRYYFPAPVWLNWVFSIGMFLAMEWVFLDLEKRHGMRVFLLAVPAICVVFLGIEFILAQAWHWLLLPFISFFQIIGQLLERLAERMVEFLRKKSAAQG